MQLGSDAASRAESGVEATSGETYDLTITADATINIALPKTELENVRSNVEEL